MELFKSRRFWVLMLDTAVSLVLHYAAIPDATYLIGLLQPIFLLVIYSYTAEGTARIKAGK